MAKKGFGHKHTEGKFIRHFIFGAEDGLISTLGFLSGIAGASLAHFTIVVAGIAEVFAAALSMGIGTYLSSKSQREVSERLIQEEKEEIEKTPSLQRKQIEHIYRNKGFKGKDLKMICNKVCSNKDLMLKEMLAYELGIIPGKFENPVSSSFVMFFTFLILAFIPLFPYLIFPISQALPYSIIFTLIALFLVGSTKTKITKRNWFKSGFEMLALGAIAALITFYIGNFVSTLY